MFRSLVIILVLFVPALFGNDRLVVDDEAFEEKAIERAAELHAAGKLVSLTEIRKQLGRRHAELALAEPNTERLSPPEIYRRARKSTVAVSTFYRCNKCNEWHLDNASGFVVSEGVISTSTHVVDFEDESVKDGFLVAVDSEGRVFPVTELLASNAVADTCLIRAAGLDLPPLALSRTAEVGDAVFCLSHPDGNHWMFTSGMLSRFFLNRAPSNDGAKPQPKRKIAASLYINVTAEYSPGSSGAPIVDQCANVVGQVESITSSIEDEKGEDGKTVSASYGMPLRSCVAAEEILKLMRSRKSGK